MTEQVGSLKLLPGQEGTYIISQGAGQITASVSDLLCLLDWLLQEASRLEKIKARDDRTNRLAYMNDPLWLPPVNEQFE